MAYICLIYNTKKDPKKWSKDYSLPQVGTRVQGPQGLAPPGAQTDWGPGGPGAPGLGPSIWY